MGLNIQKRLDESPQLFLVKLKGERKLTFQRIVFLLYKGAGKLNQFLKQAVSFPARAGGLVHGRCEDTNSGFPTVSS